MLPQEVTKDNFDQFVKGLLLESEGVGAAGNVSAFFKELIFFSKEARPVMEKRDRTILGNTFKHLSELLRHIYPQIYASINVQSL